jgi:hypothetical protein
MKAFSLPVGTEVSKFGRTTKGTVISNTLSSGNEVVAVEWENGTLEKCNVNDLRKTPNEMDKDFDQIRKSIAESHAALKEAVDLADKHGVFLRELEFEDVSFNDLENMVNDVPWASSSSNC